MEILVTILFIIIIAMFCIGCFIVASGIEKYYDEEPKKKGKKK